MSTHRDSNMRGDVAVSEWELLADLALDTAEALDGIRCFVCLEHFTDREPGHPVVKLNGVQLFVHDLCHDLALEGNQLRTRRPFRSDERPADRGRGQPPGR